MKYATVVFIFAAVAMMLSFPALCQEYDEALFEQELQTNEALILISIQDKKGTPMSGVIITVQPGYRGRMYSRVSDEGGNISLIVPTGNTYDITFLSLTADEGGHSERFEINDDPEQRYTLTMTFNEALDKEFVLKGVNFATGTANLKKSSHAKLQPLVDYMKLKQEVYVQLSGHTDNQGDPEANLNLSEARAEAVKQYLVSQGIDKNRVAATGFGDQKPIASNKTAKGRVKNRRTEVKISR